MPQMTKPTLSPEQKEGISAKVLHAFGTSGFVSRAKYATSIGISSSDFSNIENRKWRANDRLIGVEKWLRIARTVGFEFSERQKWITAPTVTYHTITKQLKACQSESLTNIFCDEAGIGKTYTCRDFAATHRNAFYLNGGSFPNRWRFIRALAQSMGLDPKGKAEEVLEDVIYYLKSLEHPLIIIDEAGDLDNSTYRMLKRLYNELELHCGFYMVGARDLEKRIDASIRLRRNSFEEVFSRFGGRYTHVLPKDREKRQEFMRKEKLSLCHANGLNDQEKINQLLSSPGDLRAVRIQVLKSRIAS
jgi:DNA transposition AAA+ family ATPase